MPSDILRVRLTAGREKSVVNGHPWIFSGSVEGWSREPVAGEPVDAHASDNAWLARGIANPGGSLAVRLYTWKREEAIDDKLFAERIDAAVALRERLVAEPETDAYRLVYSESDGISGLIVDRYADVLAVQVGAAGIASRLPALLAHLTRRTGLKRVVAFAERDVVEREGLDAAAIAAHSTEKSATVRIRENGFQYDVQAGAGHKTGFYLDQRDNRVRVAKYAKGRRVLSCYCYTGAFELHAARAGAKSIVALDSSGPALEQSRKHHELNGSPIAVDYREADVGDGLRRLRDRSSQFDLVILDPPRFVQTPGQKEKGLRAYKDINLLGIKLLAPGGILATFSCSGLVALEDLKMAVRWAAKDSGRQVRVIETLSQPPDHPVLASFPEGEYLSGLVCYAV
jgi:23S rRNA (cytosine1962-C5)-methyltransferase